MLPQRNDLRAPRFAGAASASPYPRIDSAEPDYRLENVILPLFTAT